MALLSNMLPFFPISGSHQNRELRYDLLSFPYEFSLVFIPKKILFVNLIITLFFKFDIPFLVFEVDVIKLGCYSNSRFR